MSDCRRFDQTSLIIASVELMRDRVSSSFAFALVDLCSNEYSR